MLYTVGYVGLRFASSVVSLATGDFILVNMDVQNLINNSLKRLKPKIESILYSFILYK